MAFRWGFGPTPAVLAAAQSTLDPHSEPARQIATLWWWMLVAAAIVFGGTLAMLVVSWLLRGREGLPVIGTREGPAQLLVVVFGIVIPLVVLVAVFVVANFAVASKTDAPAAGSTPMTIEVTGHQWWWEARYPGTDAVTANEIHIPVRTRVTAVVSTDDVIHSFWIPKLNRKIDMIPGTRNRVLLYADEPGRYRGQCAEYCGLQHAHMGIAVVAQQPEQFRSWLRDQAAPRTAPVSEGGRRGERVFLRAGCADCHTIRGTRAAAAVGPDLTHVGSRETLAALTIPNTPEQMRRWIDDPQAVKLGARMPAVAMTASDRAALVGYLEGLR